MFYYIIKFLACLLAVYGAFALITCITGAVRSRSTICFSKVKVVIAVRDVEEQIENIVRNAVKADLASRLMSDGNLTFVDMDSQDGTLLLLHKLKKDYENIDILAMSDKYTVFSDFSKPDAG
jgi:uncharacterized surface protein with fasciclin (FAS1) repeats